MGYPIYLGIALLLPLKEFKTFIIFANILVMNRGCSFEVKGVFVRDKKLVLQNIRVQKLTICLSVIKETKHDLLKGSESL